MAAAEAARRAALWSKRAIEAEADKLRGLAREAQEEVGVHKDFVEDAPARRGGAHGRAAARARRGTRAPRARNGQARGLKRRVDELLGTVDEAKQLRAAAHAAAASAREAGDALRAQARQDKDALRAANLALENRVAVLEATQKLESARRALV